jgi:SulP family sulfate permease
MRATLIRLLPILDWGSRYSRADATADFFAAAIVTLMLVPQSLAYAMLAGLPPQIGLYASILPLVAYALFGSSRSLAVGPVAVISLMAAAALAPIAPPGSAAYVAAATTLAWLSGLVLLTMAVLRLGVLANFLSHPVISGFISASGLLIAVGQVRHLLGIRADGHTLPELLAGIGRGLDDIHLPTLAIGLTATLFLAWARRGLKPALRRLGIAAMPADVLAKAGPLAAIVAAVLAVERFDLAAAGVRLVGDVPAGLPPFALPVIDPELWLRLLPAAVLMSLVGFVESVSVAQTLAARRRQRIDANQELVGLGSANLAAALSGGYPVTGGFARSIVNFDAGAATPLAGAFTALGILGAALFLTPLFRALPQAVLAATIIVAVLSLVDLAALRRNWIYAKADFAAMAATILGVLLIGVELGILAGVALSLLLFLWRTSTPHVAVVGRVPGTEHFRNVERHAVITVPEVLSLRVDESLYFANARQLEDRVLAEIAARPALRDVVLMCSAVNAIDASALESLEAIAARLGAAGIGFHLSEVKGPVMDRLRRSDFLAHFQGRVFLSQHDAFVALAGPTAASDRAGG